MIRTADLCASQEKQAKERGFVSSFGEICAKCGKIVLCVVACWCLLRLSGRAAPARECGARRFTSSLFEEHGQHRAQGGVLVLGVREAKYLPAQERREVQVE